MNNKKGFTLIEIIAAVIILGIISIIAVITYTNSMQEFRDSYYTSLERTLTESGKEFFEDNRNYRPTSVFTAQKVPVSILESKSYIDEVVDYSGNRCDRSSYVIAIKAAKNDYIYYTCLVCSEDTFSNLEDKYCDSSWDDASTVRPDIDQFEDAYVYKNTSQEKLREKLLATVSITKFDRAGNVIDRISGDGIDGVPQILPENIDVVDTSKVGVYTVTYKYNNKSVDRRVHVYENSEPEVVITKTNKYAATIDRDTVSETTKTTSYSSGQWAQEVRLSFTAGSNFYSESGQKVSQYQWNKGGKWEKICDDIAADGSCTIDYRTEMNEEIAFRVVDTEGNISKVTTSVIVRIDRTAPICTLTKEGTTGSNDWYHSNIKIKFDTLKDQQSLIAVAKSGIEFNSVRVETEKYVQSNRTNSLEQTHKDDSQYVWYYGFVEDKAQNYATCSAKVRKDTVVPSCSITGHASLNCSDATSKLVKVYFGKENDSAEGTALDYQATWSETGTVDSTGTWYLKATDHSGYTFQTSSNYYLVSYDKNGGDTGPTKTSEIKRETETADLNPTARKAGWKMIGWNTNKTATKAITSHTVSADVTLYAIYEQCKTGEYTDSVGTSCLACPTGYKDGAPVGTEAECRKSVSAGYFVEKEKDANAKECANGYYKEAHSVTYGAKSSCNLCPTGYQNGTAVDNKKAQSTCLKNVPAGNFVKNANDANATGCGTGTYKGAHNVTYGNKSSCTSCPAGYQAGAGTTEEAKCVKSVACGYKVDTAKGAETVCAGGSYSATHTVTYGAKSSCTAASTGYYAAQGACSQTQCPDGYRSGAGTSSEGGCIKSVPENNHVPTPKGGPVACPAGYHSSAHNVAYGNTSSCTPNTYTLTYNNNNGSGCTSKSGTYASTWGELCTPSRSGYDFKGWWTAASGGTQVTASTTVSGNLTVYAHWELSNKEPLVSLRRLRGHPSGSCLAAETDEAMSTVCTTCTGSTCPCVIQAFYIDPPSGYTFRKVTVTFSPNPSAHTQTTNIWQSSDGTCGWQKKTYFSKTASNNTGTYGETGIGTNGNFFTDGSRIILRFRNENGTNGISATISVEYTNGSTGSKSVSYGVNSSGCCSTTSNC